MASSSVSSFSHRSIDELNGVSTQNARRKTAVAFISTDYRIGGMTATAREGQIFSFSSNTVFFRDSWRSDWTVQSKKSHPDVHRDTAHSAFALVRTST
jgi:hypothetical protein